MNVREIKFVFDHTKQGLSEAIGITDEQRIELENYINNPENQSKLIDWLNKFKDDHYDELKQWMSAWADCGDATYSKLVEKIYQMTNDSVEAIFFVLEYDQHIQEWRMMKALEDLVSLVDGKLEDNAE